MAIQGLPKALLVDLDDTILAFDSVAGACWQRICNRFNSQLDIDSPQKLFSAIMSERSWFWSDPERHRWGRFNQLLAGRGIVNMALLRFGIDDTDVAQRIADAYRVEREKAVAPFPGAVETLTELRARGVRLGLITNGAASTQQAKIQRFNLGPLFGSIVIEGDFGVGKPDERVFRHSLDVLGVPVEQSWMVGDNLEWDVQGAQRVGITGIWNDWSGSGLPEGSSAQPDRIIRSLCELLQP